MKPAPVDSPAVEEEHAEEQWVCGEGEQVRRGRRRWRWSGEVRVRRLIRIYYTFSEEYWVRFGHYFNIR